MTVTYIYSDAGGTGLGSSITYTAFNSEDGKRHWTGAVLWNTSSADSNQYNHSCSGYQVYANLMYISTASVSGPASVAPGSAASFTVKVSNPDGGPAPTGTVALFKQVGSAQNPAGRNCDGSANSGTDAAIASGLLSNGSVTLNTPTSLPAGNYNLYAAYTGTPVSSSGLPSYCLTPPQSGLTGSRSSTVSLAVASTPKASARLAAWPPLGVNRGATRAVAASPDPKLVIAESTATAPAPLTVRCPQGQAPVQVNVGSNTAVIKPALIRTLDGGVKVFTASLPAKTEVGLQVVCRPQNARALTQGRIAYGSVRADTLGVQGSKATVFGGLGADTLSVAKGVAFGGPGADVITVSKAGAASGGPGNDRLVATGTGLVLLEGGLGRDVMTGSARGTTLVNARDGQGGDQVVCQGHRTFVKKDKGDVLTGSCESASARD